MAVLTGTTPADELGAALTAGWPRAFVRWGEQAFPLPWVNGSAPAMRLSGFVELNGLRSRECEDDRLCFCCGLPLVRLSIMGRHKASLDDQEPQVWLTDGPPAPRTCAISTVAMRTA